MENRMDIGAVALVIGLLLILFVVGGVGIIFVVGRQQMALATQVERARWAEVHARAQAEHARNVAEVTAALRTTSPEKKAFVDEGDSVRAAIEVILDAQEAAWNRGDIAAFMEHYWKSDALTFSSGGNTTRGWTATLNRYRERYPTPETLGRLELSQFEITQLGDSAALVLGRWNVERENEPLSGNFSLVVRDFDGRWLIVHDHTSQLTDGKTE